MTDKKHLEEKIRKDLEGSIAGTVASPSTISAIEAHTKGQLQSLVASGHIRSFSPQIHVVTWGTLTEEDRDQILSDKERYKHLYGQGEEAWSQALSEIRHPQWVVRFRPTASKALIDQLEGDWEAIEGHPDSWMQAYDPGCPKSLIVVGYDIETLHPHRVLGCQCQHQFGGRMICTAKNWRDVLEKECGISASGWNAEANGSWHNDLSLSLEWEAGDSHYRPNRDRQPLRVPRHVGASAVGGQGFTGWSRSH